MPGWLDTLNDFGDILATELGVREHLYRLKSDGLYRIVSHDRDVRVGGDLKQQVPSTVQTVPPVYPPRAKASGIEGRAWRSSLAAMDWSRRRQCVALFQSSMLLRSKRLNSGSITRCC